MRLDFHKSGRVTKRDFCASSRTWRRKGRRFHPFFVLPNVPLENGEPVFDNIWQANEGASDN